LIASVRGEILPLPAGLERVTCPPGKVALMVAEPAKEDAGILLADNEFELPDIGRVFAVGPDIEDLEIGDVVVYAPAAGKFIEWFLDVVPLACFLGSESENGVSVPVPYDFHALGKLVFEGETMKLKPLGRNMLIARSGYAETYAGLVLPDGVGNRDGSARVIEVGAKCKERKPGDEIIYKAGAIVPLDLPKQYADAYGVADGCLAFCPEDDVLAVL